MVTRKNDSQLIERKFGDSGGWKDDWRESDSKTKFDEIIGLNGQVVGIDTEGRIEFIKQGGKSNFVSPPGILG